ncbi:molybdopterin converting factor subunit 1 [Cellvibrio japonicus]|uniref:Molybdopterin synthase sulfur carrier subunit n=1 Tax=Cellvibrio japonicus (strain Ueda107) TaxID=498211 RepID=B3PDN2_CELJU|nr:molybdopterin converting factor subunit 1 [Cellvibrio japonicus]ACE84987.1 molybdenum cofactor biosynthesis protein D/E [Cellvibrio japonicus Ueda107]QEI12041.1 molybdopterin converting factor subunit 1 [Cellvibrio japonicus]QEI15616.1 molybdopterin converting factor subunit 1 [Cellvibrio japonicus]QEI19194.1 molybdopterin converting factor subunit 1 [Cellvibrio japonicus]
MIRVLFFAQLREQLGVHELVLDIECPITLEALREHLVNQHETWRSWLFRPNVLVAINQEYARLSAMVDSGDEVAFFPPVTGG